MTLCYLLVVISVLVSLPKSCEAGPQPAAASAKSDPEGRAPTARQGIEGLWQGTLDTGAIQLRVVFKIKAKPDGNLTGALDSIDQGAKDIPLSAVSLNDGTARFQADVIMGAFE